MDDKLICLVRACYDAGVATSAKPPDDGTQPPSGAPRPRRAPAPGERQQDADRSRRLLLAAALDEFAAKGYAGARVQEIAARAGVNKQLINYYFDSKEGLYLELQRSWLCREQTFADPDLPLADLAARYLHDALTEPRLTRLMAWRGLTETHGSHTPDDADDSLSDLSTLRDRQAAGELSPELDPAGVRLAIMGMVAIPVVMPHLVRRIFGLDPTDPEFETRYAAHLRHMIGCLAAPVPDADESD
jgi:AcrR family transcriptional regulator